MNAYQDKDGVKLLRMHCVCNTPEHVVDFYYYEDMPDRISVEVSLDSRRGLWDRIKDAFRHIFKMNPCFDDTILSKEDVEALVVFFQHVGVINEKR